MALTAFLIPILAWLQATCEIDPVSGAATCDTVALDPDQFAELVYQLQGGVAMICGFLGFVAITMGAVFWRASGA